MPRGDVLGVVALHQDGDAAGDFHVFDGALQLAFGFGKGLAAFQGDGLCQVGEVALHQRLEAEQRLNAVTGRRPPPVLKDASGDLRGTIDLFGGRKRCVGKDLAGRGIYYIQPIPRVGTAEFAVDEVRKLLDVRHASLQPILLVRVLRRKIENSKTEC